MIADDDRSREPLSSINVPTLVIHGTADPMFPLGHGEALAEEIPGATLLPLEGAGHGVDRADWDTIVPAILEHTAAPRRLTPREVGNVTCKSSERTKERPGDHERP